MKQSWTNEELQEIGGKLKQIANLRKNNPWKKIAKETEYTEMAIKHFFANGVKNPRPHHVRIYKMGRSIVDSVFRPIKLKTHDEE
jgi:hypothetical protein